MSKYKMKNTASTSTTAGFTLIEIIVSMAVFIVVATIAVGAFLKILSANKQAQSIETAMNNADFALDSMSRDLRVGYGYTCYDDYNYPNGNSISIGKNACNSINLSILFGSSTNLTTYPTIAFYSSESPNGWSCSQPAIHAYRYNPSTKILEKSEESQCNDTVIGDGNSPFVPLTATSSGFAIQTFGFSVGGVTSPQQPKVLIYLKAAAGSNLQNQTSFTVQTSVSQRVMNGL